MKKTYLPLDELVLSPPFFAAGLAAGNTRVLLALTICSLGRGGGGRTKALNTAGGDFLGNGKGGRRIGVISIGRQTRDVDGL
jgi:hypothetical protein